MAHNSDTFKSKRVSDFNQDGGASNFMHNFWLQLRVAAALLEVTVFRIWFGAAKLVLRSKILESISLYKHFRDYEV